MELRNEKQAHFRMLGDKVSAADRGETRGSGHEDNWEDEDEEDGFAAAAVKSLKCLGVKCATTCACNAIRSLSQATHVLSVSIPLFSLNLFSLKYWLVHPSCAPTTLSSHNMFL